MRSPKKSTFKIKGNPPKNIGSNPIVTPQTLSDSLQTLPMPQLHTSFSQTSPSVSIETSRFSKTQMPTSADELSKVATKNIAINYGQAIISFALSKLAVPYLQPHCDKENLKLGDFNAFVRRSRKGLGGISGFRALLLINDNIDDDKTTKFKKLFQVISEISIKYFSVSWITHGRVSHKLVYLKFRSKMLRRVQNPKSFSYIRKREKHKGRNSLQESIIKNEDCNIKYEDFDAKYEDVGMKIEESHVKYKDFMAEPRDFNVKSEETDLRPNCLDFKLEELNLKYEDFDLKYEAI